MVLSTFFDLPREIRDKIYECILEYDAVGPYENCSINGARKRMIVNPAILRGQTFLPSYRPNDVLAILLVNRQISTEAASCFYGNTTLSDTYNTMFPFLKGIGSQHMNMVRTVELLPAACNYETAAHLRLYKLLITLQSPRIVHIIFSVPDSGTMLKAIYNTGIFKLIGVVDLVVYNFESKLVDINFNNGWPYVFRGENKGAYLTNEYRWRVDDKRNILAVYSGRRQHWVRGPHFELGLLRSLGTNTMDRGVLPKDLMRVIDFYGDLLAGWYPVNWDWDEWDRYDDQ